MKPHILKVEQSHLDMFVSTAECPSPPRNNTDRQESYPSALEAEPMLAA